MTCHVSAGFFADKGIETRGELAFRGAFVLCQQCFGHNQPKHPVTKKLKPLVVFAIYPGARRMGHGAHQQFWAFEPMPQTRRERLKVSRKLHYSIFSKKRSPRHVQKNSMDDPADENTTRFALPIMFS